MKNGLHIRRKSLFTFFLVSLMILSCTLPGLIDSIKATNIDKSVQQKGYTLRDADINDYEGEFNPDALFASSKIDDDERVLVMIEIDDNSLSNNYITYASAKYDSLSEYSLSDAGRTYALNMRARQENLYNKLSAEFEMEYKYSYTAFMNAFSAYVRYGDVKALKKADRVHNVIVSEKYDMPETFASKSGEIDFAENIVKVDVETGIYDTSDSKNTGLGTIVAVLDTGLDHEHSAFLNFDDIKENGVFKGRFDKTDIEEKLANDSIFNASSFSSGLTAKDVYINEKVPYAYDYADKDSEVYPTDNHGTHVAGIIAGHDDRIKGAAVGAQLAIMKVFSNDRTGGSDADILAAVEDCVFLDVDVINMSLGAASGFADEVDKIRTNEIYNMVYDAGINLVCAAGNDYSSGFSSTYGLNLASNPDSGVVGSPSTYPAAISVGSISGIKTPFMVAYNGSRNKKGEPVDGLAMYYANSFDNNGNEMEFMERLLVDNSGNSIDSKEFDYVVIPGTGTAADYSGINVKGKIAVVKRGIDTFVKKIEIAQALGAIGVIIRNNVSGVIRMSLGEKEQIPACSIEMDIGNELYDRAVANSAAGRDSIGKIILDRKYKAGPFMSEFSSWGPSPDLELKPEIVAHGGDITSAVIGGGYDRMSGTSMAAPNYAGVTSLLRQHVIEHASDYKVSPTDTIAIRTLVNQLFMSTATIAINEFSQPYSPRKQGSGLADLKKAENTRAYIYVNKADGTMLDKTKLSIGDDPARTGVYELEFFVRNLSNKDMTYNINTIVMTENLSSDEKTVTQRPQLFTDSSKSVKVLNKGGSYSSLKKTLTVKKDSDAQVRVTVKLSKSNKKFLEERFANGMFIEGFVELKPTASGDSAVEMSIPYLGFYGDWADAPMIDKTIYETSPDEVNTNLQEHEKNKPDVKASAPLGRATRDDGRQEYIFSLGSQVYLIAEQFDEPAIEMDKSALSLDSDGIFMLWGMTGFLRSAKTVRITLKNAYTGQIMIDKNYKNAKKSQGTGGGFLKFDDEIDLREFISNEGVTFVDGGKYYVSAEAFLDWGDGETYGNRNKFEFEFYVDSKPPEIVDVGIRLEKDKNFENEKYFLDLEIYDAHYAATLDVQYYSSVARQHRSVFNKGLKPIVGARGGVTKVTVELTNYWEFIKESNYELMVMLCDYAWNSSYQYLNIKDCHNSIAGLEFDERYMTTAFEISTFEQYDLRNLLTVTATDNDRLAWDDDYVWSSTDINETYLTVKDGKVIGLSETANPITVTVSSKKNPSVKASINVSVKGDRFNNTTKVSPQKIKLDYNSVMLATGAEFTISAEVLPHKVTDEYRLVWTSNYAERDDLKQVGADGLTGYEKAGIGWVNVFSGAEPSDSLSAVVKVEGVFKEELFGITGPIITARLQTRTSSDAEWTNTSVSATCYIGVRQTYEVAYKVLNAYNGNERKITVPNNLGIETIGSGAFAANMFIEELIIPEGVKAIQTAAVAYCPNLRRVEIPASVLTIAEWAFGARIPQGSTLEGDSVGEVKTALTEVDIKTYPDGTRKLRTIGPRAFINCEKLQAIDLSSVASIGTMAFANCKALLSVNLSNVKSIGEAAFYECLSLQDVQFCEGAVIGPYAFLGDTSLSVLELPVAKVGYAAFANCSVIISSTQVIGLKEVKFIGEGPTIVDDFAFSACYSIEVLSFGNTIIPSIGEGAFGGLQLITGTLTLPKGLVRLGNSAFDTWSNITSIHIPKDALLTEFTGYPFANCELLSVITVDADHPFLASKDNVVFNKENGTVVMTPPKAIITNLSFPNDIKRIGAYAYANNTSILSVDLSGIEFVGEGAFLGCPNLNKITNFAAPKEISNSAFEQCTSLTSVDNGTQNNLDTLGHSVFMNCTTLGEITLPSKITSIPSYMFFNNRALKTVNSDSPLTLIGAYALTYTGISSIELKDVTYIGEGAFMLSTSLMYANLDKVETIGDYAFQGCTYLSFEELKSAIYVGMHAFVNCLELDSIKLPQAAYIGDYAFSDNFVNPLYDARANSDNPAYALLSRNSSNYSAKANLQSVELNKIKIIGEGAFMNSKLAFVVLPASLEILSPYAFANCTSLTSITVLEGNERYFDVNGVLYSYVPKQHALFDNQNKMDRYSENSFILEAFPANRTPILKETIRDGIAETYDHYKVLDGTVRIEAAAFMSAKLQWVELPYELAAIGHEAFYKCGSLEIIDFSSYQAPSLESVITSTRRILWSDIGVVDGLDVYDYQTFNQIVSHYRNFVVDINFGETSNVSITFPRNGVGYTDRLYRSFFDVIKNTDIYVMSFTTESFISGVWNLPATNAMDWHRDANIVTELDKTYNLMSQDQKSFVNAATLKKLRDAVKWVAENEPVESDKKCSNCGSCGTLSLANLGGGGMLLGGVLMILISIAVFFVFRRRQKN